jgi:nitrogen-specific signal transduction histidine kinase
VDISARKRAEQAQNRLQEQLRHAQKLEAIGTLAGGMAHDFNNLLAVIIGCGDLLRSSIDDADAKADLADLMEAAARGRDLVTRVLTFSRRQDIARRPLVLGEAVSEAAKLLRSTLPTTIDIRVAIDDACPRVLGDTTAIHQIVMNLGTNAAHAMPSGGDLHIRVEPTYVRDSVARSMGVSEGPYVSMVVRDNGQGIEPAIRERVFEPFFTTKAVGAGTGLGLALVHGIMQEHEGYVELESEVGAGTTVSCLFPAIEAQPTEDSAVAAEVPRGRGQRILLVDDEAALVRVGTRQLERLGYNVVACTRVADALAALRGNPTSFELVVTDYYMPEQTGVDFSREVGRISPGVPVLLLTGQMGTIDDRVLKDAGVRRVAMKPLTLEGLAVVVHELLTSRAKN